MRLLRYSWLTFILWLVWSSHIWAETEGTKVIVNYPPSVYTYHQPNNWGFVQGKQGTLYVANHAAFLYFDGKKWDAKDIPNNTIRSIALDKDGTIFVGGNHEIGYFTINPQGTLTYISLLNKSDKENLDFSFVYQTCCTDEGVFFRSKHHIFFWNYKELKVWKMDSLSISVCENTFLVQEQEVGLLKFKNNRFEPVPGGHFFLGKKVVMVIPDGEKEGKWLIGTRKNGLFHYDGTQVTPFLTRMGNYLKEKQIYEGIALKVSKGEVAFATKLGGLVILDSAGRKKAVFDKSDGLMSDNIKSVYEDAQGNLWLGEENGIDKIEYASPLTIFDDRLQLKGNVDSVTQIGDRLYAGTTIGLYYPGPDGLFRQVEGITTECFVLLPVPGTDTLLAGTNTGLFLVNEGRVVQQITDTTTYVATLSVSDPNRIWLGTDKGVTAIRNEVGALPDKWSLEFKLDDIGEVRTIVEEKNGDLWLGTYTRGALRIVFKNKDNQKPEVTAYFGEDKEKEKWLGLFQAAGHTIFASTKRIYRFNPARNQLVPDHTLGTDFAVGTKGVYLIKEDDGGNIWFHSSGRNYLARPQRDGTYQVEYLAFPGLRGEQIECIYPGEKGNGVWMAARNGGLVFYDVKKVRQLPFRLTIEGVQVNQEPVSWNSREGTDRLTGSADSPLEISYDRRNIRFQYKAPFFLDEVATEFCYFLEGSDNRWSRWDEHTERDYIGLEPGDYIFHVKAKNVFERETGEATFHFTILPPWYRTWWAFSLYGIIAMVLVLAGVKWRLRILQEDKQKLQQLVESATREIRGKNRQLNNQAVELKEIAAVRTRFFANISHEFRTPLTLIMGPLEQLISQCRDEKQLKRMHMINRNSQRLLALINQLLALSRIDKGQLRLKASQQDIVLFLKNIMASYQLVAQQHKIEFFFQSDSEEILLYFDQEKLEDVFGNLLSNVVNLTPAKENIRIDVNTEDGHINISVIVSGLEIADEQMEHMFDRFYLAEEAYEHQPKGFGIGLALAKELVNLHRGELSARRVGEDTTGTIFTVRLPRGNQHLFPSEIVDRSVLPDHFFSSSCTPPPPVSEPAPKSREPETSREEHHPESQKVESTATPTESENETDNRVIILLIEDNADTVSFITEALEDVYEIAEAGNGRDGIRKAKEIIPDLIITDIIMPYTDGFKVCKELKKDVRTSHIPIIMLTAKSGEEDILKGLETGADDYITKPFNIRLLQARVKNLIDLRRQWQMKMGRQMVLQPADVSVSPIDEGFIKELQEEIEKNLSDPEFGVQQLAEKLYMSRASLYRKIHALTGESPHRFIRSYRLKRAAQLFRANFGNVSEVAMEVGFGNISYFSQCFKEKFHLLPTEYLNAESKNFK